MGVSGVSHPLRLRLFLEGQEVPVISASVSIGINGPATASIQVIPLDEGMDLKPRTMVHLFFLDQVPTAEEVQEATQQGLTPSEFRRSYDKLLFTGEVIGFAFGQTPLSRSLVLQCLDFSSYWDACHATAIEYGPGGNAFYNQASVYGSNASLFDDIVNFQSEKILSWIKSKPLTPGLQNISGLAGGIIAMLEAIGGVPGHSRGVNDFFTFSELRGRILAQITAEEGDDTAARVMSAKVFDEWLRNGLQNIGQQVTFRDMLKLLCQFIYYDTVPNPVAKFDKSYDKGQEKTTVVTELRANPLAAAVEAGLTTVASILSTGEQIAEVSGAVNAAQDAYDNLKSLSKTLSKVSGKESKTVQSYIDAGAQILAQRIIGDKSLTTQKSKDAFSACIVQVGNAKAGISGLPKVTYETGVKSTATTARLRTQIVRPDCFFSAPPRCNVIFPEHFSQVSYDRMYLSEVTRSLTMVYNTLVGRDMMLADKVMAPNNGLDMAKIQKQVGATGYTLLMPHERHTGIIPRSEWLPNIASFGHQQGSDRAKQRGARLSWVDKASLFHFFKYRLGPRQAQVAGRFNPYVVCGFPALIILKPFVVSEVHLGFLEGSAGGPISISQVIDAIQLAPAQLGAPYQLLGMVGSVSHSVSQDGGTTSIAMHHVRKHQGIDDDFIGLFSESLTTVKRRVRVPLVASNDLLVQSGAYAKNPDALKILELLVKVTPTSAQSGQTKKKITKQETVQKEVSSVSKSIDKKTGKTITVTKTSTIDQTIESVDAVDDTFVTTGRIDKISRELVIPKPPGPLTTNGKGRFGKIVGVEVTDADLVKIPSGTYAGKFVYRSVILYEDVDVKVDESVPIEEILRPSWFSEKYSNAKIGTDIYMPFFGTTSIIDSLSFTGLSPESINLPADPEGEAVDPAKKTETLLKELKSNNDTKSKLSIEKAVNVLGYLYGLVKTQGKDVDQFIRDYATRPVATMTDLLGTEDFKVTYDSKGSPTVEQGSPGFHGLAVERRGIQQGNLAGLLKDPDRQLPRVNKSGEKAPISPVYDVRREKLDRVDKYILALRNGPGLRG